VKTKGNIFGASIERKKIENSECGSERSKMSRISRSTTIRSTRRRIVTVEPELASQVSPEVVLQ